MTGTKIIRVTAPCIGVGLGNACLGRIAQYIAPCSKQIMFIFNGFGRKPPRKKRTFALVSVIVIGSIACLNDFETLRQGCCTGSVRLTQFKHQVDVVRHQAVVEQLDLSALQGKSDRR